MKELRYPALTAGQIITNDTIVEFYNGCDALLTPVWNLYKLAPQDMDFLLSFPHADPVLLALVGVIGISYVILHLNRLQKSTVQWNYSYIANRLYQSDPNNETKQLPTKEKLAEILSIQEAEIDALFSELFPNDFDSGIRLEDGTKVRKYLKPSIRASQNTKKPSEPKNLKNTLTKYFWNTWGFLGVHSYGYWVLAGAMILVGFIGTWYAFTFWTALTLPVVLSTPYIFEKITGKNATRDYAEKANKEVLLTYYLRQHKQHVKHYLAKLQYQTRLATDEILKNQLKTEVKFEKKSNAISPINLNATYSESKYVAALRTSKKDIFIAGLMGGVVAFIVTNTVAWAITDMLSLAFSITAGVPAVAAFTIPISIALGIHSYFRSRNEAQNREIELQKLYDKKDEILTVISPKSPDGTARIATSAINLINAYEWHNSLTRNTVARLRQQIDDLVAQNNALIQMLNNNPAAQFRALPLKKNVWNPKFDFPTADNYRFFNKGEINPTKYTYLKKGISRALAAIGGAGTGSFLVRILCMGGVLTSLFVLSHTALLTAIGVAGLIYGGIRLYQMQASKTKQRQENFIHDLRLREECLLREKEVFDELCSNLEENKKRLIAMGNALSTKAEECINSQPKHTTNRLGFFRKFIPGFIRRDDDPVYPMNPSVNNFSM